MTQREELEKMQEILRDKIENTIPDYSADGECSRCGRWRVGECYIKNNLFARK